MQKEKALQQVLYDLMKMQIRFGVYRFGDSLPVIKEVSDCFFVSVDTVRLAYVRLKQEGFITLSTGVGALVKVRYSDAQVRRHVRTYFLCRQNALLAFARSAGHLTNDSLIFALKNAAPETLAALEQLCRRRDTLPVYRMACQLQLIYKPLGNEILLRLVWQMFLFYQAPLVSVPENIRTVNDGVSPLLNMIRLVDKEDWTGLKAAVEWCTEQYFDGLNRFYAHRVLSEKDLPCGQMDFNWSIYKKTSQICYSLCMEMMMSIHEGEYAAGSFLPPPRVLAGEKNVSQNTIRRTLVVLNKLGVVRTVNGVGTLVLPPLDSAENCDFTDPTLRKRLTDFLSSMHILSLSCRQCAQATVEAMQPEAVRRWLQKLETVRRSGIYEDLIYSSFEMLAAHAPEPAVRTVYGRLSQQLFWGFPLRDVHGDREQTNQHFLPYLQSLTALLKQRDAVGVSVLLEKLQQAETGHIRQYLLCKGIREAESLYLSDPEEENAAG